MGALGYLTLLLYAIDGQLVGTLELDIGLTLPHMDIYLLERLHVRTHGIDIGQCAITIAIKELYCSPSHLH